MRSVLSLLLRGSDSSNWTLIASICWETSFWVLLEAIAPNTAQAYTDKLELYLNRQLNETYEVLVHRAENTAMTTAQQRFDSDPQISKVIIIVTAENNGLVAPIFTFEVSRNQWKNQIEQQRWLLYFRSSKTLLGFEKSRPARVEIPIANPVPRNALPPEPPGSPL
jgi:hypothetical protein